MVLGRAGGVLRPEPVLDRARHAAARAQPRGRLGQQLDAVREPVAPADVFEHADEDHGVVGRLARCLREPPREHLDAVEVACAQASDPGARGRRLECIHHAAGLAEVPCDRAAAGADLEHPRLVPERQRAQDVGGSADRW